MEKLIYFDGLTKDKFFDSLFTMLLGIDTLQQYFNRLSLISNDGYYRLILLILLATLTSSY